MDAYLETKLLPYFLYNIQNNKYCWIVYTTAHSYLYSTNLKEGNGKLWAGQTKVTALDSILINPFRLISSENLGLALPIGSAQLK